MVVTSVPETISSHKSLIYFKLSLYEKKSTVNIQQVSELYDEKVE